ncbi:hypothetical protein [Deinococcus radiophilus]|uniref:Uncharacterized protein n=1 Tax=Deinococcus radiophilus TaxID=32062 RepID=A0A3S0KL32_9DEIO|nr:hypothetical protein [Deinococcus radiophilus]RTR29069.1 hypothetical protein EJ104_04285 [Deinococcus radiophilus]UFA49655.1 hypothetical protein LMT64_07045 [Deinococcus radiophilus]
MIYRLIGVTGYTLPQVMALTMPQLEWLLEGCGQMLYPRLKPQLDAQFAKVSSAPNKENPGGISDVRKIIVEHRERLTNPGWEPTLEQQERAEAYAIQYADYLPPRDEQIRRIEPLEGLPAETAQAIMDYAAAGLFPTDIWAHDVVVLWREIQVTARVQT